MVALTRTLSVAYQRPLGWVQPADGRECGRAGRALPASDHRLLGCRRVPPADGRECGRAGQGLPAADHRRLESVSPADGRERGRAGRALPSALNSQLEPLCTLVTVVVSAPRRSNDSGESTQCRES
jgi:hypothetical protein